MLTLGITDPSLPRLDNDPQVFLGAPAKTAQPAKGGEKPLLIPDFISVNALASNDDKQEIRTCSSGGASIVIRASKAKLKPEGITLSMWKAANSQIMHKLLTTGKLSANPA